MKLFSSNSKVKSYLLIGVKLAEGKHHLRYSVVRYGGKELPKYEDFETIEDLHVKMGSNLPVILHINGFGVLSRITEKLPNFKDSLIISGDKDEFYFNSIEFKNTIAVSFVRKNLVAEILEELKHLKFYLLGIHLGPIPLLLETEQNQTITLDYSIKIANGDIVSLDRIEQERSELFFSEKYLAALYQAIFNEGEEYVQALPTVELANGKSNYKEYKLFVRLGLFILGFYLFTLTANYFYVNHLNQKAIDLESEISSFGENLSLIDRLNQEKQRKLILAENSGVQGKTFLSYYLDRIGATVPSSINLEILTVYPLVDNLKPKMKVELETKKIVVHGFCANSNILDDWMEYLESKDWIDAIELINYVRLSESKSKFHLLIKLDK